MAQAVRVFHIFDDKFTELEAPPESCNRTNDIMRALTVLTAIFLPLNLVTGFFGMNFEGLPLIHSAKGFWIVFFVMLGLGVGMSIYFWRKRYLDRP